MRIDSIAPTPAKIAGGTPVRSPIVGGRVELQLLTTLKCNLKCTYCSLGVGEVLGSQTELSYDIDQLAAFVDRHLAGKEVYVTFYGGEEITDAYRGRGIWSSVMRNVAGIRQRVGGTLTARVTWSNPATSFEELDGLADSFDYLYFQFVADDMYQGDSVERRKAVLVRLIEKFFARSDVLYPLVPLMGIVRNKLLPSRAVELYAGQTQCRVSTHLLNIMPNGQIFPCPDLMYAAEMQMGEIQGNWLRASPLQPQPGMPCEGCEAFPWCRRNCLKNLHLAYVNNDEVYRRNVVEPICDLLRFIGREIDRHDPREWFARLPLPLRRQLLDAEVYEYVEIMP